MDIVVNTGLDNFVLLNKIFDISETTISGFSDIHANNSDIETRADFSFKDIEAAAQLCAHHVRFAIAWKRHAFLLGIKNIHFTATKDEKRRTFINADRIGQSDDAVIYIVSLFIPHGTLTGEILIGLSDYASESERTLLAEYYRELWTCFTKE